MAGDVQETFTDTALLTDTPSWPESPLGVAPSAAWIVPVVVDPEDIVQVELALLILH